MCNSGTSWSFPLVAFGKEESVKYLYTPLSNFRLDIRKFPHFILEVVSGDKPTLEKQNDLWQMILQASCLARLGNEMRTDAKVTGDPVVIMAVYIDKELNAHEYLVYQPDVSDKKVWSQIDPLLNDDRAFHRSYIMRGYSS